MDSLPEHDPTVEAELFARLAAEMEPFLETSNRGYARRDGPAPGDGGGRVGGRGAGLSRSVLISAAGYTTALFALVSLGNHADGAWGRMRQFGRVLKERLRYP